VALSNKLFRLNFYWQIIVLLAGGIFSVAVIGSLIATFVINMRVSDLIYDQAKHITSSFAHQSILPLLSGVGENAENDINALLLYPNVKSLGIYDANGELLIGSDHEELNLFKPAVTIKAKPFEAVLTREDSDHWVFGAPVYDADIFQGSEAEMEALFTQTPKLIGYVTVSIDRSNLFSIQKELLTDNFVTSVAIALILIVITGFVIKRMIRPLHRFIGLMEKAEAGDDSVRAGITGPIEIEHMTRAFNTMMQSLEQRRLYSEEQHDSLVREVRERKQAEKALKKSESHLRNVLNQHEAVVSTVPGIIVQMDRQGKVLWWNRRVEDISGLDGHDIETMNAVDFFPPDEATRVSNQIEECFLLGKSELHADVLTARGLVPYQFIGVRIDDPSGKEKKSTLLAIGMDNSESIAANLALKEAHDSALESSLVKSEFLANMSHEIRTPMNGMMGMLQLLGEGNLNAEQKHYVDIALKSADHLLNIINDVLDFSKIEAGKLQITNSVFSLRMLIEDVAELFSTRAHEKGLRIYADISFDVPDMIVSDPHRIKQIISNLVGNAIKFTDKGYVMLRATANSGQLHIDVIDTGIGIDPEVQKKVFDSFAQVDGSSTRKYSGTGLGLAIVKQLAELMGGSVGLTSEPNQGSDFSVTIPFTKTNIAGAELHLPAPEDWQVHYVSDDDIQAGIFSNYTNHIGQKFSQIRSNDLDKLQPEKTHYLFLVDAPLFNRFISENLWIKDHEQNVLVVLAHAITERVDDLLTGHEYVIRVMTPVRYSSFVGLLTRQEQQIKKLETETPAVTEPAVKGNVLVVEDNEINRHVIVSMLTRVGLTAVIASNGKEAVDILKQDNTISLVFMDCQMPVMDGYQATKEIRKHEESGGRRHVPIIAMTGHAMHGDREKCLATGMDDYISKPIRLAYIKEAVIKWGLREGQDQGH
jgi:PAS domain S-box-containing protein